MNSLRLDDDVWELYDTNDGLVAGPRPRAEHPEKLAETAAALPDRGRQVQRAAPRRPRIERINSELAGRPTLVHGESQILYGGMGRLSENSVINLKNKSFWVTAGSRDPQQRRERRDHRPGQRVRQGGASTSTRASRSTATTSAALPTTTPRERKRYRRDPSGRVEFAYDGGGLGKGGTATMYVDGAESAKADRATVPMLSRGTKPAISAPTRNAGQRDYTSEDSAFTGKVHWVQLEAGNR